MACIQIPTLMLITEWSWASLHHEIFHLSSELKTLSSIVLAQDPEISLLNFIPKRIESRCSNKNLYMSIHRSIIHKSQKGETTQTFINWWMDEQNVLYPYCCCEVASVVSDSVRPHRWQPTGLPRAWDSPGKNTGGGCHFLLQCMTLKSQSEVAQSCLTLSDLMDCRLPGSSLHPWDFPGKSTGVGCHCLLHYIHTVEYYSVMRMSEALTPATTRMNLGAKMPIERT